MSKRDLPYVKRYLSSYPDLRHAHSKCVHVQHARTHTHTHTCTCTHAHTLPLAGRMSLSRFVSLESLTFSCCTLARARAHTHLHSLSLTHLGLMCVCMHAVARQLPYGRPSALPRGSNATDYYTVNLCGRTTDYYNVITTPLLLHRCYYTVTCMGLRT